MRWCAFRVVAVSCDGCTTTQQQHRCLSSCVNSTGASSCVVSLPLVEPASGRPAAPRRSLIDSMVGTTVGLTPTCVGAAATKQFPKFCSVVKHFNLSGLRAHWCCMPHWLPAKHMGLAWASNIVAKCAQCLVCLQLGVVLAPLLSSLCVPWSAPGAGVVEFQKEIKLYQAHGQLVGLLTNRHLTRVQLTTLNLLLLMLFPPLVLRGVACYSTMHGHLPIGGACTMVPIVAQGAQMGLRCTPNVLCPDMGCAPDVAAPQVSIVRPTHPTYRLRVPPFALAPARPTHLTRILSMRPTPPGGNRHGAHPCPLGRACTAPPLLGPLPGPPP